MSAARPGSSESADCVVTNPPFFEAGTVRVSPDEGKARAHVMPADAGATLADWISASLAMLAPAGGFVMIHRPEALGAILAAIGSRLGGLALLPVHPTTGRERASPARLGRERLEGAAAPCARPGPARGRRPADGGSGRHPSRRAADRLGRLISTSTYCVIWVFLARSRFPAESAFGAYWIFLDFLGFSRPNRDLSMSYTGFSLKNFRAPFASPGHPIAGRSFVSMRKADLFMERA